MTTPILTRILAKVIVDPDGCWRWTGAMSQSGRRGCFYPAVRILGATWRVNRVVLLFLTVPKFAYETWAEYLQRAAALHVTFEAAHTCDHSYCVNPEHLQWESHPENIQMQARRRAVERQRQVRLAEQTAQPVEAVA